MEAGGGWWAIRAFVPSPLVYILALLSDTNCSRNSLESNQIIEVQVLVDTCFFCLSKYQGVSEMASPLSPCSSRTTLLCLTA